MSGIYNNNMLGEEIVHSKTVIKKVSNIVLTNLTPTVLPGDYKLT
jgi:hypothetical protein